MKRLIVAALIALAPLTVSPAFASPEPSGNQAAISASWPTICFKFAFWKYCI